MRSLLSMMWFAVLKICFAALWSCATAALRGLQRIRFSVMAIYPYYFSPKQRIFLASR